ncbi:PaaI family thioesterase [Aestuariicella hydrocarbonica]|uniref:PaaI family thioesterase n=1 Tax=Pseudomaricurvus hydrocarbonicus TaxID=1470433 RepID=A0A9E5JW48_9GAMM|nr:PaaI family thioesterase [Aestuariicella hydrocarbonica]NHO65980.1 PaaI family thioesterase [Aestuariicella hydrocarbonica]
MDNWTRREMKGIPASLEALWTQKGDDGWRYAVKLDESHANAQGLIHGGVLMTFMDHALSLMVWEKSDRAFCSTVHLDSHFLSAVRPPAFVELEGEILKQGRNLAFARGVLKVEGKAVMEGKGVWSITRPQPSDG